MQTNQKKTVATHRTLDIPKVLAAALLFCVVSSAQVEPEIDSVFYALAHDPDRLISLERQTATIRTSGKFVGIGGTAKSSVEFKPGKSPVRVSADGTEFVVRTPFAQTSVDFNSLYVLRSLSSKGGKRELLIAKAHAYVFGTSGSTQNLAEGEIPILITKQGQHSLKIVPAQPLKPGEYALSMRASFLSLFCFGVDE